jgi:DNA polymerase
MKTFIDFETASSLSVKDVGAYVYAAHPSTHIRLMAWAIDNGDVNYWTPGERFPDALTEAVQRGTVHAWNAQFERLVWSHKMPKDLPAPTFNQWRCSAALARINGLPGALDDAARVLKTQFQKMKFNKDWADVEYPMRREDAEALARYCTNDVLTEREIEGRCIEWTDDELYVYQLNERINDRGILVDTAFCTAMTEFLAEESVRLNVKLANITGGAVRKLTEIGKMKDWIFSVMAYLPTSLDKNAVERMLRANLPPSVRRVLEIRRDGGMSSTSKYQSMLDRVSRDDRLRGMFMFAGAGQTGRFSSTGAQVHNLVRTVPEDYEHVIATVKRMQPRQFRLLDNRPLTKLASQLIRPTLLAKPGHMLVIGDYSAIEAKALPWLAGNQAEVDLWASGDDRYIQDAMDALNIPRHMVGDRERQIGKVVRLACGYSGKKGAVLAMAEGYGLLDMTPTMAANISTRWHAANAWVEAWAKLLESAALGAVGNPNTTYSVCGKIHYCCDFVAGEPVLRCTLPSGRVISYFDCRAEESQYGGYQLSSVKPRETTRERLWHGLFAENVDQAVCNDFLRHSMVLLAADRFDLVAHVHDEHVAEVPIQHAGIPQYLAKRVVDFKAGMEERPSWALDFPLTAKVAVSERYAK